MELVIRLVRFVMLYLVLVRLAYLVVAPPIIIATTNKSVSPTWYPVVLALRMQNVSPANIVSMVLAKITFGRNAISQLL